MWYNQYVGLPFKEFGRDRNGVDCWGLFRLIYKDQFGIDLPVYDQEYKNTEDHVGICKHIEGVTKDCWAKIEPGKEGFGDAIILRLYNVPMHVGFVTKQGWMLHILEGIDASHERYTGMDWKDRVLAFYRHRT